MKYLAHISEDGREQTVQEHLKGTAERCAAFASAFGAEEQGLLAGMAHDIGKFSQAFQKRLLENGPRVDHATAGAYECSQRKQVPVALTVAGHHSGLPDMGSRTDIENSSFQARLSAAKKGKLPDYSPWSDETILPDGGTAPLSLASAENCDFYVRMLYSCLTDADYLDTEDFMSNGAIERASGESLETLHEKLNAYTSGWFPPKSELNVQRCAVLEHCRHQGRNAAVKKGLFSLTVPTGGGKTIASLAFALHHAVTHGMSRIIYVIPYTSIIEQTADTFRAVLGKENILEHHSGVVFDQNEELNSQQQILARATENWDMPVIVTTAVQFFESVYGNRSSSSRKLHNLANSVIIFDEAQMLPLPYLKPCVSAIAQLTENYGASAVLCTATQPALNDIFREYLPETPVRELCPFSVYDASVFRRVTFRKEDVLGQEELAERMQEQKQALCIVNTRKSAKALYELLGKDGSFHLSTLMVPAHRKEILRDIRERLEEQKPCRVVSTSLMEAGVDVDFPAVYRELAGLDSVLQAAGRCNREGKRSPEESVVTVFSGEDKTPPLFRLNSQVAEKIMDEFADFSDAKAVRRYFEMLIYLKGKEELDKKNIMGLMKKFAFSAIAKEFRLIEQDTQVVYIPWGEQGEKLIGRLRSGERSRALFREAGLYSVALYSDHFRSLVEAGSVQPSGAPGEELWVLTDMTQYDEKTGLSLKADSGQALFG